MKSKSERNRIILSRIAVAIGVFVICTTQSYWETKNEVLTFSLYFVGVIFVAVASLGRMWCSLYIAGYKDHKLVTQGPYSLCRNPLYFFSMIGMVGIGCATETFTFPVVFLILFAAYYPFVIRSEEDRLKQLFGADFEEYRQRVPTFFPKFSNFVEPETYNVKPAIYRKHMFSALWFIWIIGILEVIEGMIGIGWFKPLWFLF